MVGVEILSSNEVVIETAFNWLSFFTYFGILFAFSILIGFLCSIIDGMDWTCMRFAVFVGLLFSIPCGIGFGSSERIPVAYETQYKVVISDEVSMNCFLEKYEILDQEGKIYTVRERLQK